MTPFGQPLLSRLFLPYTVPEVEDTVDAVVHGGGGVAVRGNHVGVWRNSNDVFYLISSRP